MLGSIFPRCVRTPKCIPDARLLLARAVGCPYDAFVCLSVRVDPYPTALFDDAVITHTGNKPEGGAWEGARPTPPPLRPPATGHGRSLIGMHARGSRSEGLFGALPFFFSWC